MLCVCSNTLRHSSRSSLGSTSGSCRRWTRTETWPAVSSAEPRAPPPSPPGATPRPTSTLFSARATGKLQTIPVLLIYLLGLVDIFNIKHLIPQTEKVICSCDQREWVFCHVTFKYLIIFFVQCEFMSFLNFNFWLSKQDKPECVSGFVIVDGGEGKAMK